MADTLETPYRPTQRLLTGHFRESAGYRAVRRRGVSDWLLVATTGGRARFGHNGGDLIVEEGDWVLLRPGTPHDYGAEETEDHWELVWAHFQPRREWMALLEWPEVADGLMRLRIEKEARTALVRQFQNLHHQRIGSETRREAWAFNAFEALLLDLDRQNQRGDLALGDARIARAMAVIEERLTQKLLVDGIAETVGLSPSRLAHLFRQETGETVQGHIETRRLQRAADLLRRTSFPIKQIAADTGYESQFYFSQRFRRWAGMSPSEFRAAQEKR